jgi:hypothetical protein
MLAYEVSLTGSSESLAVAWHGGLDGRDHDAIWLQPLDTHDRARGPALRLTDGVRDAYEPDLRFVGSDVAVAWYEKDADGAMTAWLGRFDLAGQPKWRIALSPAGRQGRNPVVRTASDGLHVAWLESGPDGPRQGLVDVNVATVDAEGRLAAGPLLAGEASNDTWNLNAAMGTDGAFYVVYDAHAASRAKEIELIRAGTDGVRSTRISTDDGSDSTYPDIAFSGDRAAIAWSDMKDGNAEVYVAAGPIDALIADIAAHSRRVTQSRGTSIGAYLAWNGPRLLLAWCDDTEGPMEIYREEFDAAGSPTGNIQRVTRTTTDSLIPAVRPLGSGFALAWTERRALRTTTPVRHDPTASSEVRVERVK